MSKFSPARRTVLKSALSLALLTPLAGRANAAAGRKKAVVLGLDAIDPRLLQQYWDEGRCPNLRKLAQSGHFGPLESCHPPMSPAAWSTMCTGLNPGKHGISGFLRRKPGTYEPEMALAEINETPVFGGTLPNRVGYSFAVAMAALGMSFLAGKGGKRIADHLRRAGAPRPHQLVPGAATLGMLVLVPLLAAGGASTLALAAAGVALCVLLIGYSGAAGSLRAGQMIVPFIGLSSAIYAVLRRFPAEMPQPYTSRKGEPFWAALSRSGYRCKVLAAPVDWPAEQHLPRAQLTTGLGTPDALGTFHTFSLFTEEPHARAGGYTEMGGRVQRLEFKDGVARATLAGPPARFQRERWQQWEGRKLDDMPREEIEFDVRRHDGGVTLNFEPEQGIAAQTLKVGQWTEHLRLHFNLGGLVRYAGCVRLKLMAGGNAVRLYATPVTFDPLDTPGPFRVSVPADYAAELARKHGEYSTLGWAEATSALNDDAIDDQTFLETCDHIFAEREKQWLAVLDKPDDFDVAACFFYDIDRICHMMWRHMDPLHPAHDPHALPVFRDAVRAAYERSDRLVGEVLKRLPEDCVFMVCSDHGFQPFYRQVNLNRWLINEGYAVLRGETGEASMRDLFTDRSSFYGQFDWSKTRAYGMGLGKIYINQKGREPEGIVGEKQASALIDEIVRKLEAMRDDERGGAQVVHKAYKAVDIWEDWNGKPPRDEADIEVGFAPGYRISWQTTLGGVEKDVIFDNVKNWSGDHCTFAPVLVPGVILSNHKLKADAFRLVDVGVTVLDYFGVKPQYPPGKRPGKHDGRPWTVVGV